MNMLEPVFIPFGRKNIDHALMIYLKVVGILQGRNLCVETKEESNDQPEFFAEGFNHTTLDHLFRWDLTIRGHDYWLSLNDCWKELKEDVVSGDRVGRLTPNHLIDPKLYEWLHNDGSLLEFMELWVHYEINGAFSLETLANVLRDDDNERYVSFTMKAMRFEGSLRMMEIAPKPVQRKKDIRVVL